MDELAYFTAAGLMIPLFAAGPPGADKVGVGFTVGAFSITALILRPFAGRMADQRGRRPLLIGGALLSRRPRRLTRSPATCWCSSAHRSDGARSGDGHVQRLP